jgi:hypothetical protein
MRTNEYLQKQMYGLLLTGTSEFLPLQYVYSHQHLNSVRTGASFIFFATIALALFTGTRLESRALSIFVE